MVVGIVVEYNPFHNGHLYQINEIKKLSSDAIIAVMSGDYVQRGEISFIDKWEKTDVALKNGVDLVVELPLYYSIQNAEIFCREAVKILNYLEIKTQFFGAESENIQDLNDIIQIQNTDLYASILRKYLKSGENYSVSHYKTLKEFHLEHSFLSNNILAMEYMKTIKNYNFNIKTNIIKRKNVGYNDVQIKDSITSASNIRKMFKEGEVISSRYTMPEEVYNLLIKKTLKIEDIKEKLYELFRYKILNSDKEKLLEIYDIKEDFLNRLLVQSKKNIDYQDFICNVKSKNFSNSRINRAILNILLDINYEDIENSHIEYVRVLGFNEKGREHLHNLIKKRKKKNIYTNWKDIEKNNFSYVRIEKAGFLMKELILRKKEKLNSTVKVR